MEMFTKRRGLIGGAPIADMLTVLAHQKVENFLFLGKIRLAARTAVSAILEITERIYCGEVRGCGFSQK